MLLGVAPFPGATTGTGGRIRDVHCTGRGAHVVAGTAGYSFGNLHIPGRVFSFFLFSIGLKKQYQIPLKTKVQVHCENKV